MWVGKHRLDGLWYDHVTGQRSFMKHACGTTELKLVTQKLNSLLAYALIKRVGVSRSHPCTLWAPVLNNEDGLGKSLFLNFLYNSDPLHFYSCISSP